MSLFARALAAGCGARPCCHLGMGRGHRDCWSCSGASRGAVHPLACAKGGADRPGQDERADHESDGDQGGASPALGLRLHGRPVGPLPCVRGLSAELRGLATAHRTAGPGYCPGPAARRLVRVGLFGVGRLRLVIGSGSCMVPPRVYGMTHCNVYDGASAPGHAAELNPSRPRIGVVRSRLSISGAHRRGA